MCKEAYPKALIETLSNIYFFLLATTVYIAAFIYSAANLRLFNRIRSLDAVDRSISAINSNKTFRDAVDFVSQKIVDPVTPGFVFFRKRILQPAGNIVLMWLNYASYSILTTEKLVFDALSVGIVETATYTALLSRKAIEADSRITFSLFLVLVILFYFILTNI